MEKKEPIKISLPLFITIIVLLVAVISGIYVFMQNQKLDKEIAGLKEQISKSQSEKSELQEKLNDISNITTSNISDNNLTNESKNSEIENEKNKTNSDYKEVSIPDSNENYSEFEKKNIEIFQGVWISDDGEKILAIDYGKRFCYINKVNNNKEYGLYTIKDTTSNPKTSGCAIVLEFLSGKTEELAYFEGSSSHLESDNESFIGINGYYFGAGEGDEGIFNK